MHGVGSSLMTDSVQLAYGSQVLKILVRSQQIIYEFDQSRDTIYVYGLLYSPPVAQDRKRRPMERSATFTEFK